MIKKLKNAISAKLEINELELFEGDMSFADVMAKSELIYNSIDILEAFAGAIAENNLDEQLELPVFTLDSKVKDIILEIECQLKMEMESV